MEEDSMREDGYIYRTADMAEAALLAAEGFEYELEKLNQFQAAWVFDFLPDEEVELNDFINMYRERRCRVEPKAFLARVKHIRNELYTFLGKDAPRPPDDETVTISSK
jgi:hypothetical protein